MAKGSVNRNARITNIDFVPCLLAMITFSVVIGVTHVLANAFPIGGQLVTVPLVFVLVSTWAFRGRHNFGRAVSRGHFDEIDILQLAPKAGDVDLWDPPTKVERTPEEVIEHRELMKELSKVFQEGFEDKTELTEEQKEEQKKIISTVVKMPEVKKAKKKDAKSDQQKSDFHKRQEEHYANEFAIARKMLAQQQLEEEERLKKREAKKEKGQEELMINDLPKSEKDKDKDTKE